MRLSCFGLASSAVLAITACSSSAQAQGCKPITFAGSFRGEETLCQNWDAEEQQTFWFLSQGSQIIPYSWFLALEQATSETRFGDGAYMDGFRYLPQRPTGLNPDGLPIGFTKDSVRGSADEWLGMTCAACHTGQVEFNGRKMLIDGAPTMADFEGFMHALVEALQATQEDDQKFDRFVTRVLGPDATSEVKGNLRQQLKKVTETRRAWNQRNEGDHPYGFARLDAIGAIFNEVTAAALGIPENRRSANAPVSYPFVWDTPQHDRVQWNGSVENKGAGSLGRNVGEVLGVFGSLKLDTDIKLPHQKTGHESSVNIEHLGQLEELLWKLQSPQWPGAILPPIDNTKDPMGKGRQAFVEHCRDCHADIRRDDPRRRITAVLKPPLSELGTDPAMAVNFANRVSRSGPLQRRLKTYLPVSLDLFGHEGAGVEFLRYAVTGVIVNNLRQNAPGTLEAINAGKDFGEELLLRATDNIDRLRNRLVEDSRMAGTPDGGPALLAYKARPLNGIWATAPYLHNGSVRTMRQLLLPAGQRQRIFHVGSREYDPKDMGFVDAGGYLFDTSLPGDSNSGHEGALYGTDTLSADPETLESLLEYLKTL